MTTKFNKGDKVVCANATLCADHLSRGATYTVSAVTVHGGREYIRLVEAENQADMGWFAWRFILVERAKEALAAAGGKKTRCDQVLNHLLAGHSLTQGEAIMLGMGTRLAATVHTLKKRGHNIVTRMKTDANGYDYAEYSLVTRNSRNGNIKRV